jgi:Ca2+-binding RTX toxin-like protein
VAVITGTSGNDTLNGTDEYDEIYGLTGNDTLNGGLGYDMLWGDQGDDVLNGGDGNDFLDGGDGRDTLNGGAGDDFLVVPLQPDAGEAYSGGDGFDTLSASFDMSSIAIAADVEAIATTYPGTKMTAAQADQFVYFYDGAIELTTGGVVDLAGGMDQFIAVFLSDLGNTLILTNPDPANDRLQFAGVYGGAARDIVYGSNSGKDTVEAGGGNDTVIGNGGDDKLEGGDGDDVLDGGDGHDLLDGGRGKHQLTGGTGSDTIRYRASSDAVAGETIDGGSGTDRLEISLFETNATFDLSSVAMSSVEILNTDVSTLLLTAEQLDGFTELMVPTATITTPGTVDLRGAAAWVRVYNLDPAGNSLTFDALNVVTVNGGDGNDTVSSGGREDWLTGNGGNDVLKGNAGNDRLAGNSGADRLEGGDGSDSVQGGAGADRLIGGAGADLLRGGFGGDRFHFNAPLSSGSNVDRIADFNVAADQIELENSVFTALSGSSLSSSAFYVGSQAHDSSDRIIYNSESGALYYDANGNAAGSSVQFATLAAQLALTASDFMIV